MMAKIKAVTVGEIAVWLGRGLLWAVFMLLLAYLLGIEWSWKIATLCVASGFIDTLIYPSRHT